MPCELEVRSASGSYSISIGIGSSVGAVNSADVVVVDQSLQGRLPSGDSLPIAIAASESIKTLAGVEALALALRERGANRKSVLCAVGGGSIQDVATLTAALYMRGIPWTYVPTTLMAMADSCIGGKSAINAGGYKNLLGNFNPPSQIFVDPELAMTLGEADLMSGLAEAVKICYASGLEDFTAFVETVDVTRALDVTAVEDIATMALVAKRRIVEIDEFDTGERQLLNFGHTFGHALEVASDMGLPHGLGVAIGMRAALRHPLAGDTDETRALDLYSRRLLQRAVSDGWATPDVDWARFQDAFESDKKHLPGVYRMVLPGVDGRLQLVSVPRAEESIAQCVDAARTAMEETQ